MKKQMRYAFLFVAGFGSAVAFQNCSPASMVKTTEISEQKPVEVVSNPTLPERVPTAIPVQNGPQPESVSLSSKLLKNRKWTLEKYLEANHEVAMDNLSGFAFEMSDKSVTNGDQVCAGDCGRAFPIAGTSACGEFQGAVKVRFIESIGSEALGFEVSNVGDVCASEDVIDGEGSMAITDQILQDLDNSSQISLKNNVLTVKTENRTAIFKATH